MKRSNHRPGPPCDIQAQTFFIIAYFALSQSHKDEVWICHAIVTVLSRWGPILFPYGERNMNRKLSNLVLSSFGALALVGCGGSGGGGNSGPSQVFPSGFYVSFDSTIKMSYMSDFSGSDWNKQFTPSAIFGIDFDPEGNMIGVNWQNNRLVKFTNPADLSVYTTLGTQGSGALQFDNPTDVAIDSTGRIYVADAGNQRIVRMDDFTGAGWTTLDVSSVVTPSSDGMDITIGPDGKIYFSARLDDIVACADDMADTNIEWYGDYINSINDVKLDDEGRIYIVDGAHDRIVRIDDISGAGRVEFGEVGTGMNQFDGPIAISLDRSGRIYVLDTSNSRICRFDDMTGDNWTTFGTAGDGVGQFVEDGLADMYFKR